MKTWVGYIEGRIRYNFEVDAQNIDQARKAALDEAVREGDFEFEVETIREKENE